MPELYSLIATPEVVFTYGQDETFGNVTINGNLTVSNPNKLITFNAPVNLLNDMTVTGRIITISDKKVKTDIVSINDQLSNLSLLNGYQYNKFGNKEYGLLAQDVEKVYPHLVSEHDGLKAVSYQEFIPILINAVNELSDRTKEL